MVMDEHGKWKETNQSINQHVGLEIGKKWTWKELQKILMTKSLVSEDELHMLYTKIEQMNRRITQLETQVTSLANA